jgi:hypothetical protein
MMDPAEVVEVRNEPGEVLIEFASKEERVQSSKYGLEKSAGLDHEADLGSMLAHSFELMIKSKRWTDATFSDPLPVLTTAELDHGHPGLETCLHLEHALRRFGHGARWIALHAL